MGRRGGGGGGGGGDRGWGREGGAPGGWTYSGRMDKHNNYGALV